MMAGQMVSSMADEKVVPWDIRLVASKAAWWGYGLVGLWVAYLVNDLAGPSDD